MSTYKNKITIFFMLFTAIVVNAQKGGYLEANIGLTHYNSYQNNLVVNPNFGVNVNHQFTDYFAGEIYCNGVFIDEDVNYFYNKQTLEIRNEQFIAGWLGFRAVVGTTKEKSSFAGFLGFACRFEKNIVGPEVGFKYGYRIAGPFWFHTSAYVQMDKCFFYYNDSQVSNTPLIAGFFQTVKVGVGYHFD